MHRVSLCTDLAPESGRVAHRPEISATVMVGGGMHHLLHALRSVILCKEMIPFGVSGYNLTGVSSP